MLKNGNFHYKKSMGQHFLKNPEIARHIVDSLQLTTADDVVFEIGPGSGILTQFLIDKFPLLKLIELDREAISLLKENFQNIDKKIIRGNILKIELLDYANRFSIIGNMPYNISGPLLFNALKYSEHLIEWVGMLQLEVVQRILARPKTKEYGKLSVLLQAYFDIKQIMRLSPASFYPPPKVSSAVIRMIPKHTTNIPKTNYDDFVKIVKLSFTHRRKTLRNNLLETLDKEILKDDFFNKRPEELSWQEYDDMIQHFLYKNN
ncbi:MAG: 16S rRNA (adenine(1518)-N(6)/adenine(1519)-N(6))-dimethyltransferase RsmA [Bacteroidales bacterium]|jgi:16S rRNA (adenine1518-N6/adenine1519-N6)-dimethyltransferase|nr:ribosomal RNA small subunit methyltransferase A [Bacteroidales bacterium]MDI9576199.1 16S rRNA (adenine(1518)-N(6)/adenine(1519)-N(6))-dimethyltransferase RsmA [Bacteroidota bacterium]MDD2593072.1 16S rRNA (adenine(1518)-N(6)/adenine(1519)-N(6))-dimethyltransferase RsmA [Bacteroidales bacterium]MDD3756286.1 16S rRNA (adenine(1518)-N(6)/adenine(1519)-N(6))-dimethyltransferase RsmA [Bacteroidales bacterium]MDY0401563.1 16S rRNA (adenine(1518)-N(6)/adenine(1519)-N(6))-dimethyltransferase RsmA [